MVYKPCKIILTRGLSAVPKQWLDLLLLLLPSLVPVALVNKKTQSISSVIHCQYFHFLFAPSCSLFYHFLLFPSRLYVVILCLVSQPNFLSELFLLCDYFFYRSTNVLIRILSIVSQLKNRRTRFHFICFSGHSCLPYRSSVPCVE